MITVFSVSKAGTLSTRLFLPESAWGEVVLDRLHAKGYTVSQANDQSQYPDPRGPLELARRDELLEWASPY
jgi:hypothetical protein